MAKRSREARSLGAKKKQVVAPALVLRLKPASPARHCEERNDEAIQFLDAAMDCFASLAMTKINSEAKRRQTQWRFAVPTGTAAPHRRQVYASLRKLIC
jgi:predicted NAD/FAD-dependent oxidoreductase